MDTIAWIVIGMYVGAFATVSVFFARALKKGFAQRKQAKDPNLVRSRLYDTYVHRYSEEHVLEELFWGNSFIAGPHAIQLGMNGVD